MFPRTLPACLWSLLLQGAGVWPEQWEETEVLSSEQISFPPGGRGSCSGKGWILLTLPNQAPLPWQLPAPQNSPCEHR